MPWRRINGQIENFNSAPLESIKEYAGNISNTRQLETDLNNSYSASVGGKYYPVFNFNNGSEVAFQLAAATYGAELMRDLMYNNQATPSEIQYQFKEIMSTLGFGTVLGNLNSEAKKAFLYNVSVGGQTAFNLGKVDSSKVKENLLRKVNQGTAFKTTTGGKLEAGVFNGMKVYAIGLEQAQYAKPKESEKPAAKAEEKKPTVKQAKLGR
jgi:hypothetical protein